MIKNYFKTAWRNLWKNKTFCAINVFGLSVGVAAFLLIINYLRFEYSYDDAHVKKTRYFVCYQSVKAAITNPVKNLRND